MYIHIVRPNVSVTSSSSRPTVGEPFSLECNIIVIKGIIGEVDIIWTANGRVIKIVDNVEGHTTDLQDTVHSDVYEISKLQPCDNNTIYRCEAIIKTNAPLNGSDSIALTISKQVTSYMAQLVYLIKISSTLLHHVAMYILKS